MLKNDYKDLNPNLRCSLANIDVDKFQKCTNHAQRVDLYLTEEWQSQHKKYYMIDHCHKTTKNDKKSVEIREAGNLQFRNKKYLNALQTYTSSIAWAKSKATASLAYGNRSAVLAKFGFYEECLIDIERAFIHEYPDKSKAKLLHRQRKVRELLLQKNGNALPKTEIAWEKRNSLIQSATNSIKIENNEKYGRHIVAAKNIKIGELLVVEEPYAVCLDKDFLIRCHQCATRCYNLIPCDNCTEAMYCTETCKQEAYQNYHKYECLISYHVAKKLPPWKMILKITLTEKKESVEEEKDSIYRSDRFHEISQLVTHADKYPHDITSILYYTTAVIFILLKEKTTLFKDLDGFEETFKESFLLNLLRWRSNAIGIGKVESDGKSVHEEDYASGLYSLASLFNHSCYPNTFFDFEGPKLIVRALASIKKGEQCFISYGLVYHQDPNPLRAKYLHDNFFFTCECKACEENWPAVGESFGDLTYVPDMYSPEENKLILEIYLQNLASIEDEAPSASAKMNFLRRTLMNLYRRCEILPQAL